jgi:hypothetical protein
MIILINIWENDDYQRLISLNCSLMLLAIAAKLSFRRLCKYCFSLGVS